jgi:stage II sporulation protein AA (anti-sigma F factor antagonist)
MKSHCFFETERKDGTLILILHGEIDHHNAVRIRTEMDALLYEERPTRTVLDLSHIEFMDSSGLGLIMGRYSLMQKIGGELILRRPHERIVKIFELAGLGRMVKIEEGSEEEQA